MRLATLSLGLILGLCPLSGCSSSGDSQAAVAPAAVPAPISVNRGYLVVSQQGKLVRLDHDGQNPLPLTTGFADNDPSYRPSGADIIFSRQSASGTGPVDIQRVNPEGGGLSNLTAGFPLDALDPDYSKDGAKIVFSARIGPGDQDLYLMNADGTGATPVTSGPELDTNPAFSPDGRTVVFERGARICQVASTGGPVTDVTEGSDPSYSPGNSIVFSRATDLWLQGSQGATRLTNTPQTDEFQGRHSPEQDRIYALADPTGDVVMMKTDGSQFRQVTTNLRAQALAVGPAATAVAGAVPMNAVNNSTQTMYVYVFGYDPNNGGAESYLATDGSVKVYAAGSGVPPVVATVGANGGKASVNLPPLTKARVYFSTNANLVFTAFEESPGLNSASELYDFIEYNLPAAGATFTADTSCVEAFAIPFVISSTPAGTANGIATPVGIANGGRTRIFSAIQALGAPWSNLIVGNNTRLLAPWHGDLASPPFPSDYLNPSIALQWGQNLTLNTYLQNPPQYYVANASTGSWTFQPQSGTGANVTFPQPPTSTLAFNCNIPFTSTDAGVGSRITAMLAAGLNRGTLLYPNPSPAPIPFTPVTAGQPDFSPVDFYKPGSVSPQVPQVNQYANILHQNSILNYQYGFASDDQGSQSSTLTVTGIQSLSVTVSSF